MLKLILCNKKVSNFRIFENLIWESSVLTKKISFFIINVTGRIFRWVKYETYMEFVLPVSNKPFLFLNLNYFVKSLKNKLTFFIIPGMYSNYQLVKILYGIKKPSIFNKRGFRINNKIFYKKKGKITTYITNK